MFPFLRVLWLAYLPRNMGLNIISSFCPGYETVSCRVNYFDISLHFWKQSEKVAQVVKRLCELVL